MAVDTALHVCPSGCPYSSVQAAVDAANGDYHIGAASAARDAGVDSGVSTDMDGEIRPMGLGYDLGVDEYLDVRYKIYLSLVRRG